MEPANRAPRRDPPGDRVGFTSFAAILRLLSHQCTRDPFLPFTARPQVCPSSPSLFRSRYRSNFPSDVRRDFRESNDPFSKDPILSRLSGTREPGLSRPLPLVPFLSLHRIRYSFIYSLAVANNGSCFLPRGIDRTFRIRGLLRLYGQLLIRIGMSQIRIAR